MAGTRLALHLGTHKTGTSAIQNCLYRHREQLAARYLFRGDRPNSSLWMLQAFAHDLGNSSVYRHRDLAAAELEQLKRQARAGLADRLASLDGGNAILSAESLSTLMAAELQDVHDYFREYFDEIEVLIYFRPLKSRIESAFQERLKRRMSSLEDRFSLGYAGRVEMLDNAFGQDNIRVFRYARDEFPGGDVVRHFMQAVGEQPPLEAAVQDNNSLSLPAIQLLYAYRREYPKPQPGDKDIVAQLAHLAGPPLRFHSDLYSELCGTPKWGVRRFEKRVGFSISEDVEAHDAFAVRNESDLLAIPDTAMEWLRERTEHSALPRVDAGRNKSVAEQVRSLAQRSSA